LGERVKLESIFGAVTAGLEATERLRSAARVLSTCDFVGLDTTYNVSLDFTIPQPNN